MSRQKYFDEMEAGTQNLTKSKSKAWLSAMRLRTLPLALASTLTGAFLVLTDRTIEPMILAFTIITTILLQINSNLANDFGDFMHGTDADDRVGPERALQSGVLRPAEMIRAIYFTSVLAFLSGLVLLWMAPMANWMRGMFVFFGLAAIYASIRYTAGTNPYGYRGLGDLAVMLFFGVLGVIGAYVCQTGEFALQVLLPALSIGALSTGVLNINNTRDIDSDQKAGKRTLAVKLGPVRARIYHVCLLLTGMALFAAYAVYNIPWGIGWVFLLAYPLFVLNAYKVFTIREAEKLDPLLKQLAISTFIFSLLIGIGLTLA